MKRSVFAAIAAFMLAGAAQAQVSVSDAWIRATVAQQKATGAFMHLRAASDSRLVEVRTPVAGAVEIHQMEMKGQMMSMHPIEGIDLPAGRTVSLESGGYHIMLLELKHQLKEGEMVPLTLVLKDKHNKRDTVELKVPVKPITFVAPKADTL